MLAFVLLRFLKSRKGAHISLTDISDGRELLIARGRRVTGELTELADPIAERDDETATRQHQRALDVVASARSRIGRASGQRVQTKAHQELDEAEWLIGVLRARLDGFVEPAQPRPGVPATCFFDGEHGLATVEVDLEGMCLQRIPVRSCAACAVGLVRGERPRVGTIMLGGRAIPWPTAPRWCGSYDWPLKDLKYIHYDGMPIFGEPERPESTKKRQTVAERARGMRARVLPTASEELDEEAPEELDDEFESYDAPAPELLDEEPVAEPAMSSAFAAMESETPASAEAEPVSASDTPAE